MERKRQQSNCTDSFGSHRQKAGCRSGLSYVQGLNLNSKSFKRSFAKVEKLQTQLAEVAQAHVAASQDEAQSQSGSKITALLAGMVRQSQARALNADSVDFLEGHAQLAASELRECATRMMRCAQVTPEEQEEQSKAAAGFLLGS